MSSTRVLDTRKGIGAPKAVVGPGKKIAVSVTNGVAASTGIGTITAVVMNATVTDPTEHGDITVYPDGETLPETSNVNYSAHEVVPNLVTVKVGVDDKVDLTNNSGGSTDLVGDVEGYYVASTAGSYYLPNVPDRLLDTRKAIGGVRARWRRTRLSHSPSRTARRPPPAARTRHPQRHRSGPAGRTRR